MHNSQPISSLIIFAIFHILSFLNYPTGKKTIYFCWKTRKELQKVSVKLLVKNMLTHKFIQLSYSSLDTQYEKFSSSF